MLGGSGVDELTMTYEVRRHTTVMKVTGVVDADRSADLDDGLEVARTLRQRGPIVVDLSGVEAIAASALLSLMRAVQDSERADRTLTVRGLFPAKILTSRLLT
jgi:anti-anti-sigma regulatory factor